MTGLMRKAALLVLNGKEHVVAVLKNEEWVRVR